MDIFGHVLQLALQDKENKGKNATDFFIGIAIMTNTDFTPTP